MTIKKRLFLSNILMIIIPAFLSIVALGAGLFLFFVTAFPHAEYRLGFHAELVETRYDAAELAAEWLAEPDARRKSEMESHLTQMAEENQLTIRIFDDRDLLLQFGDEMGAAQQDLEQSLAALNGDGTVSNGEYDLFGTEISANGNRFQLRIANPVVTLPEHSLKAWAVGIGFLLVILVCFIIFLTNRFLTRFVFRKIADPLKTLAESVRQIRDGNLTHQIAYTEADEFQPVCEDFNEMARRLKASVEQTQKEEESRRELLAGISHDIRSPLTSIRAYVEGLLDGVADTREKQALYLSTIRKKTVEIDQMVKKLFLFAKMELGEYPYNPECLDLVKEIRDFVLASAEEYLGRGLRIELRSLPEAAAAEADPTYFRSILQNLLDNSAKYKGKETGTASLSGEISAERFFLYADDDGPGVPEEALPKLFDVFYRSDPSRKNPNQGSGLGLAIVAKSVKRMGGSVHAENRPEGGLRVVLEFPLKRE